MRLCLSAVRKPGLGPAGPSRESRQCHPEDDLANGQQSGGFDVGRPQTFKRGLVLRLVDQQAHRSNKSFALCNANGRLVQVSATDSSEDGRIECLHRDGLTDEDGQVWFSDFLFDGLDQREVFFRRQLGLSPGKQIARQLCLAQDVGRFDAEIGHQHGPTRMTANKSPRFITPPASC